MRDILKSEGCDRRGCRGAISVSSIDNGKYEADGVACLGVLTLEGIACRKEIRRRLNFGGYWKWMETDEGKR